MGSFTKCNKCFWVSRLPILSSSKRTRTPWSSVLSPCHCSPSSFPGSFLKIWLPQHLVSPLTLLFLRQKILVQQKFVISFSSCISLLAQMLQIKCLHLNAFPLPLGIEAVEMGYMLGRLWVYDAELIFPFCECHFCSIWGGGSLAQDQYIEPFQEFRPKQRKSFS